MYKTLVLKIILFVIYAPLAIAIHAQTHTYDKLETNAHIKQEHFYDSLAYKANRRKVTSWLYDALVSSPRPYVDRKALALDYFNKYDDKIIEKIQIKALDVFGPSFEDTLKTADNPTERIANKIHTKSNLKTIKKMLLFKVGDPLDPETMFENERIIRDLSYIKDAKILVEEDSLYSSFIKITVLIKDRFSYGISGGVNGTSSGDLKIYNKNIFGRGHAISVKFVGHIKHEPYLGTETYYSINNIAGRFLDIRLGHQNTYRREGLTFSLSKPFITQNVKWGYGLESNRMFRTDRISNNDPVLVDEPLNLFENNIWAGRSFNISTNRKNITELVIAGGVNSWDYYDKPVVAEENSHFFANHTLYLLGITLSQRRYIQDQLIYSYGITEDIPEGFKHELVFGYDANEFGDRKFLQFTTTNGNLLVNRKGYVFSTLNIGGYFKNNRFEEGEIYADFNFISKLHTAGTKKTRSFMDINYTLGIRRYDIETLSLGHDDHIRGFHSSIANGKQRLNIKLEHVVFLPWKFYKFNMAIFGFYDMGIIGSNNNFIFNENYYSGIGLGLRIHNENLVFETFRLRLALYPFPPDDFHLFGALLDEQSKQKFTSFEPVAPAPIKFE